MTQPKKKFIIIVLCLILSGCSPQKVETYTDVDKLLKDAYVKSFRDGFLIARENPREDIDNASKHYKEWIEEINK